MRVVEVARFGGPEVLDVVEVPAPVPAAGEAVIDVAAADVLWVETMIRRGEGGDYFPVRPPYRPGVGVAGTVSAIGDPAVGAGWLGRRVVSRTGEHGGYVEQALVPVDGLIPVPDELGLAEAAALLHDGVTAVGLLDVVRIRPGDRVLITAAAGGLGTLLVQLAKRAGGQVVAAARGERKLHQLRLLGADLVVDYSEPDWIDRVRAGLDGLDVVLDGAGSRYGRVAVELLVPGGRFSGHGTPSGEFTVVDPVDAQARGITVTGIDRLQFGPEQIRRYAAQALAEAAAGQMTPLIWQTFPLAGAAEAHAAIENRAVVGKALLTPP